jgi:hypothetical protein
MTLAILRVGFYLMQPSAEFGEVDNDGEVFLRLVEGSVVGGDGLPGTVVDSIVNACDVAGGRSPLTTID